MASKNPLELSDNLLVEQENKSRVQTKRHPGVFYTDEKGKTYDYNLPEILKVTKELKRRGIEEPTMVEEADGSITDNRSPERVAQSEKWVQDEFNKQKQQWNPKQDKRIHFIFGNGGTGKSTYIRNNGLNNGAFLIDSDEFVENYIDESKKGNPESAFNTFKVHEESSQLRNKLLDLINKSGEGYNFVVPKVKPLVKYIKPYVDKGYNVSATFLDADKDTSLARNLRRYAHGGRLVPTSAYLERAELQKLWSELVNSGLLSEYYHYDANGDTPKLLQSFKKNK